MVIEKLTYSLKYEYDQAFHLWHIFYSLYFQLLMKYIYTILHTILFVSILNDFAHRKQNEYTIANKYLL